MTTNHSLHAIGLVSVITLLSGGAGCEGPAPDEPAPAGTIAASLDTSARQMALGNQMKMELGGSSLVGRVWFASDAYGEIYEDHAPSGETERFVHFVARGTSELATKTELAPQPDDSLDAYVARTRPGSAVTRFDLASGEVSPTGADVLTFQPSRAAAAGDGDVTIRSSALTNEACPKATYDAQCTHTFGYFGDRSVNNWNVFDRSAVGFSAKGTSAYGVICADRGTATLSFTRNGVGAKTFDVSEGFMDWAAVWSGWSEDEYCADRFIVCLDYRYKIKFQRHTYAVTLSSRYNAHFCGDIRTHDDEDHNFRCRDLQICPGTPSLR